MQSIEELIASLSPRGKLAFLAEQIGYTEVPVDIETFLNDEYYLGKSCGMNPITGKSSVYPIWHYALSKVYPDPIRTSTFVANCGCIGCLSGDTKIKLIDGRTIPIEELYDKYPRGGFEVYSYDIENQSFEVGTCSGVYNTGKKKIYKLRIKDKDGNISEIKCTGTHKFLLTSGIYKEAKDLSPNDSLEGLYFQYDSKFYKGYQEFFNNKIRDWYPTHRWTAGEREFNGSSVHHIDFNKLNNSPSNLHVFATPEEHSFFHANEYWSREGSREERRDFMSNRNINGNTSIAKLKKFCSIIKYIGDTRIGSIEGLRKIRDEYIRKGYIDFRVGNFKSYSDFVELYNSVEPSSEYLEDIERNLANFERQQKRTLKLNKNHPRNRPDITLDKIIQDAQKNQDCNYDHIAKHLNCSRMRVATVLAPHFLVSADFYEYIGIRPSAESLANQRRILINIIKDIGALNFEEIQLRTKYSREKIIGILLQKYASLKDFAEDAGIPFENHTVLTIEETDEVIDVYDMTVDKYHNYGIEDSSGNIVFVHNSGKSTMAKIMLAYDIYKVTKLKDAPGYFGLMQKYLHFVIFNLTKETAEKMVSELRDWLDKSPYFRELKKDAQSVYHWITIDAASRMSDIISNDVISIVYSEMNFVRDFEAGIKLINQGISRIEGRFQMGIGLFNHVILDSSDSTVDAPVPYFLTHHPKAKETLVFKFAIWEAKKDMYFHKFDPKTKKVTFTVYKGDSEILPCIVTPETDIRKMDPDRFIEVPNELLDDFKADIELALNDKAGVAVETTTQYFQAAYVIPHMKYDMQIPEIITIDFFGDESYIPIFEPVINRLPHDRCLFGRIDLGLKNDRCGFSLGYIEDLCPIDMDGVITFDPKVVVPVSVGISRYEGQETSIDKLSQLIIWIHSQIPFIKFTTDTFQSSAIKQKLIASEIPAEFLSVDRDTKAYKVAKQMIYKGKVTLPKSTLLKNELINLMDLGKKIDHHQNLNANGDIGSNSKDVADSLAGLLATMHDANEDCMEPPLISNTQKQRFNQKMLENWLNNQHERQMHSLRNLQLGYPEGW